MNASKRLPSLSSYGMYPLSVCRHISCSTQPRHTVLHIVKMECSGKWLLRWSSEKQPWACVVFILTFLISLGSLEEVDFSCSELLLGQYQCSDPEIDNTTQTAAGCTDGIVYVDCFPAPGLTCDGTTYNGTTPAFKRAVTCRNTEGYSYRTTLLLSIFLGMFGVDRIYLGYPALGLLKFCTMGLLFVGHFVDVILIATQVVGPADGSAYEMDYFAPMLMRTGVDNETYYVPQDILT